MQLVSSAPWIPRWGISYRVGIDGISLFMVLLTTAIMPLSVLASWQQIEREGARVLRPDAHSADRAWSGSSSPSTCSCSTSSSR